MKVQIKLENTSLENKPIHFYPTSSTTPSSTMFHYFLTKYIKTALSEWLHFKK